MGARRGRTRWPRPRWRRSVIAGVRLLASGRPSGCAWARGARSWWPPSRGEHLGNTAVLQLPEALSLNVVPRGTASAENDESPAGAGLSAMRRRGLEPPPGYPDQALNLVRACTMRVVSFHAVDFVHAGAHIGRSGCRHHKRPG